MNTTNFSFWPQGGDQNADIPIDDDEDEDNLRYIWDAGTLLETPADDISTWHGVRELGKGASGRALLWVRVDQTNVILDVSALTTDEANAITLNLTMLVLTILQRMVTKDSKEQQLVYWMNPVYWRDNLPTEIAIQTRLRAQNHQNIHQFRGHRLNMEYRRYRLFNDYCDYGDAGEMLNDYYTTFQPRPHGLPLDQIENHLPEGFLWHVFGQLADGVAVLRNGNGVDMPGKPWREIVHGDLCLNNVFVIPPRGADGQPDYDVQGDPVPTATGICHDVNPDGVS